MPTLQWSDSLVLGLPTMDATHRAFVDLLAGVVAAADAELLALWRTLVTHTDEHFAREDGWMKQTGFASTNCHSTQHQAVLQVMREGERRGHQGDLALVRQMADELGIWFPQHAHSMDAALALHLRSVGCPWKPSKAATGPVVPPVKSLRKTRLTTVSTASDHQINAILTVAASAC